MSFKKEPFFKKWLSGTVCESSQSSLCHGQKNCEESQETFALTATVTYLLASSNQSMAHLIYIVQIVVRHHFFRCYSTFIDLIRYDLDTVYFNCVGSFKFENWVPRIPGDRQSTKLFIYVLGSGDSMLII